MIIDNQYNSHNSLRYRVYNQGQHLPGSSETESSSDKKEQKQTEQVCGLGLRTDSQVPDRTQDDTDRQLSVNDSTHRQVNRDHSVVNKDICEDLSRVVQLQDEGGPPGKHGSPEGDCSSESTDR